MDPSTKFKKFYELVVPKTMKNEYNSIVKDHEKQIDEFLFNYKSESYYESLKSIKNREYCEKVEICKKKDAEIKEEIKLIINKLNKEHIRFNALEKIKILIDEYTVSFNDMNKSLKEWVQIMNDMMFIQK